MIEPTWMDAPIWTAVGRTMAHMLWLGLAVGLLGAMLRRMLRRHSPELRHNVALVLLVSLGLAPAVIGQLVYEPGLTKPTGAPPGPAGEPTPNPRPAVSPPRPAVPLLTMPQNMQDVASRHVWMDRLVRLLPIAWALGTSATLLLLSAGWIGVERLRRSSVPIDSGPISELCRRLSATIGLSIHVGVAVCDRLASPVLIGLVRPLILLPPAALSGWTSEELELVLWHELAHLRRHDHVWIVLQRGVEAFLFFQPAVWWLSSWVRLERELCCDRIVVARSGRPRAYAEFLARLAGIPRPALSLAFNDRSLSTRIARILNLEPPSRRTPRMRPTLPEGLGTLALVISLAAIPFYATARAQTPAAKAKPDAARMREYLRKVASEVKLDGPPTERDGQIPSSLVWMAEKQLRADDRAGALETLRRADAFIRKREANLEVVASMQELANHYAAAGDKASAAACLKFQVEACPPLVIDQLPGDHPTPEQIAKLPPAERAKAEAKAKNDLIAAQAYVKMSAIEWAWGWCDRELLGRWLREGFEGIGNAPAEMQAELLAEAGIGFQMLGEVEMVRRCISQLDQLATSAADDKVRGEARVGSIQLSSRIGDVAARDRQFASLTARAQEGLIQYLMRCVVLESPQARIFFDPPRIKFGTGGEACKVEKPAEARKGLAEAVQLVAKSKLDSLARASVLAKAAELQAKAGDLAGALATVHAIPDGLTRKEFPKATRGHCDALKTIALAAVAAQQAKAGDINGARTSLAEAKGMAAAILTGDEKVVGTLAVARGMMNSGLTEQAKTYLGEVTGFLESQPEPRRSRALLMVAEHQLTLGNPAEAARLIETTRAERSLQRQVGYMALARDARERGDLAVHRMWTKKYVEYCSAQAKLPPPPAPKKPTPEELAQGLSDFAISAETYFSPDANDIPAFLPDWPVIALVARYEIDDRAEVLKAVDALPPAKRTEALSRISGLLWQSGDTDEAFRILSLARDPKAPVSHLTHLYSGIETMLR